MLSQTETILITTIVCFNLVFIPLKSHAAVLNPTPSAKVSFTFDDGYTSAITQAAPVLAKYGLTGTNYVITNCAGMTTVPNNCRADRDKQYMTWDQITQLNKTYGWEIGSHTANHYCLASTGNGTDCQTNQLTPSEVDYELLQSKTDLNAHGINAKSYASPYGDYNSTVLAQIAKYYSSQRGFADIGYNVWPNSDYYLKVQQVQKGVTPSTVQGYINNAVANKQWLILVFHDIKSTANTQVKGKKGGNSLEQYQYSTTDLDAIAAYVKSVNIPAVNVSDGLVNGDTNLLPNSSFNNGISDGWTTDDPSNITADGASHGNYPDATNSIRMTSGANNIHLFSPRVAVNAANSYVIKNYLSVQAITSGEVGFYIDEYDANGNWISGQYKTAERSVFTENLNFNYIPSSATVTRARLQVSVGGTGISAYLDNSQWFSIANNVVPPPINLMPNSTFDAGITGGWRTDNSSAITFDSANNGSLTDPVNSIKIVSGTNNTHLFSPKIAVVAGQTYNVGGYLNITSISSGEVAYYIDEYDINGVWISGQYKTSQNKQGAITTIFQYLPTSSNVKSASLQLIVVGNSSVNAYFDSAVWTTY